MMLVPGARLGPYEITAFIGAGGMGEVYEARDRRLGRPVAVKVLRGTAAAGSDRRLRFEREARAASALNHPHICTIHDFGEHDGQPFLVMELLDGETLRERLLRGPLDAGAAIRLAGQIADALDAAHRAGVIHRDVKPGNIFVNRRGEAKICDFGLAKVPASPGGPARQPGAAPWPDATTREDVVTASGVLVGTTPYMSPEQLRGGEIDVRADLFSFGAVLYEMVTGRQPFAGRTSALVLDAILNRTPLLPGRLNPHVPDELSHIIVKALEKDPALRYQSAAEMKADLQRLERGSSSGVEVAAIGPAGGRRRFERRIGKTVIAVSAFALAVALITLFVAPRLHRDQMPAASSRQLTNGPGTETEPAISPDGRMVAYTSDESGNKDIWIVEARGGPPRRLTTNPANDWGASWFPDGSALAFVSDRDGRTGIWKAPLQDGDAAVPLAAGGDPAVSPDGKRIAFVTAGASGSRYRVAVASLDDLNKVTVLTGDRDGLWDHATPAWSPDGGTICYGAWDGLWLVPAAGGKPHQLTDAPSDVEPAWSADGRFVYFSSNRDGIPALWRVGAEGGAPARVMPGSSAEHHPAVSRDGHRLAFSTSLRNRSVVIRDLTTNQERPVTSGGDDTQPSLGPGARTVYFVSDRWGRVDLWAQTLSDNGAAGPPRPVTDQEGTESNPACSPDGRWVAYYRVFNDRRDIWVAPTPGGSPVRFTDVDATETHPAWSPDGSRLAFVSFRGGSEQIWVRPIVEGRAAGRPVAITSGRARHATPAWSPDGSWIAYSTAVGSDPLDVAVVAADGSGTPRILTSGAHALRVRWTASKALFVSGTWETGQWELRMVDAGNGQVRRLTPPIVGDRDLGPFDVSRDGRFVVLARNNARGNIWLLDADSRPF